MNTRVPILPRMPLIFTRTDKKQRYMDFLNKEMPSDVEVMLYGVDADELTLFRERDFLLKLPDNLPKDRRHRRRIIGRAIVYAWTRNTGTYAGIAS